MTDSLHQGPAHQGFEKSLRSAHPFPKSARARNPAVKSPDACPYCEGTRLVKKGFRRNKFEDVPLFLCRDCRKKFSPLPAKHRTFPLPVILSALNRYHRLDTAEQTAATVSRRYGLPVRARNVRQWVSDFQSVLPIARHRSRLAKAWDASAAMILESRLLHGLKYDFKFHRAKTALLLSRPRNRRFESVRDFLESVPRECPHDLFRQNHAERNRASKATRSFRLDETAILERDNVAVAMTGFVLPSVTKNTLRHGAVQTFMLLHDTATVAVEVPITLTASDIAHFREALGFDCPVSVDPAAPVTGHIDLVQIRNGKIYILDYKPGAEKEKPIEQLMIYALALSRRARLPLYDFVCAWFDDRHYWEFFPLPVVHKKKAPRGG